LFRPTRRAAARVLARSLAGSMCTIAPRGLNGAPWSLTEEEELLAQKLERAAQEAAMTEAVQKAQQEAEEERILREAEGSPATINKAEAEGAEKPKSGAAVSGTCFACGQKFSGGKGRRQRDGGSSGSASSSGDDGHTTAPTVVTPGSSRSGSMAEGWSEAFDKESGDIYYYNTNGETTWEKPMRDALWSSAPPSTERHSPASSRSDSVPEGWKSALDAETGDKYYYNRDLGVTTWDKPRVLAPLPDGWQELIDGASGDRYYVNMAERRVQWERPRA